MRRFLSLFTVLMLSWALAFSQSRSISGTVTDESGSPVPFATVTETGTRNATTADASGKYVINQKGSGSLTITATGFNPVVSTPSGNIADVTLVRNESELSAVVVTALGIRRDKNTLPYAAQQISGDEVSKTRTSNAASALSGKVSGLQITQGNGIGGSTNIIIRGNKSLTGNNQALFVVDGVPVDNSVTNTLNQRTGRGGYDYGNAAADINPDDIESINVLKGAAATALYGSRAANGVIMITTKKARKGLGVTINSGVTIGKIDKTTFPTYQKEYGAGYTLAPGKTYGAPAPNIYFRYDDVDGDGKEDLVVSTSEDASYGAKYDPNLMVFGWDAFDPASPYYKKARPWVAAKNDPSTFYETAVTNNNSIMMDGASDKGSFKLGYSRNDEKGVLPNSNVLKNIVNFGATYKITEKLTATALANYSNVTGKGRFGTGYSGRNVNQNFRQWYQTNVDIQEQKEAYFRNRQNISWNWKDPSPSGIVPAYTDNYYWTVYENYENDNRARTFGNVALDYKATDWLGFMARVSVDHYNEFQEERIAVGSQGVASYTRFDRSFTETNYDLMANVDKQLTTDFNLKALAGINMRRNLITSVSSATSGGLIVPKLYSISNSKGIAPAATETYQPKAVDGYFGGVTLTYQDFLTLDGTFRRDRSSTLPVDNFAYNYYAISGSWLFSQHLKNTSWLSYGKLRLNYATVGNDAPWGSIEDVYFKPNPFSSAILFSLPSSKNNTNLKPERTTSKEIGLEMAFLRNRLSFDVSYYDANSVDQIFAVATSTATGYSNKFVNAGKVNNKGIELSVIGTPVKTQNFSWTVNVNFSNNKSKVVDLYEDSKNLQLGSFQGGISVNATLGQPYGTIQGKNFMMIGKDGDPISWDGKSPKLIGSNGYYMGTSTTSDVIGNVNPDWIGGVYNTFRYKNLSLGFLVDVRQGGDLFSLDMFYASYTGVLPMYAGLNDLGKPVRNDLADGGGRILEGVTIDGKPNTQRVVIDANSPTPPQRNYVYDGSFVKLREVNISYSLPDKIFTNVKAIKGIDLSIIGRNLWIIHKNLPYSDPEENLSAGNIQGYQSGAYPTTRSIGFNINVKF